ncbi:MAG: AsmA family protein [Pseudomonadota bacterium]
MPLSRRRTIALSLAGFTIGLPLIVVLVVLNMDWNRAKPWLNARTSEAIGRPFAIRGDLSLTWRAGGQASDRGEQADGWRAMLPWPYLVANDVHVGNPAVLRASSDAPAVRGAGGPHPAPAVPEDMASVSQLSFSLNPLALLGQRIAIPVLRFEAPLVYLQRNVDGNNNWTFHKKDQPSPWQLDLERVVFAKGSVHLIDAVHSADITAEVDTLNADPGYGIAWVLSGKLHGETLSGSGKAGAVLSLQRQSAPYPLAAEIRVGDTRIAISGTLTKPTNLAALDLRLKLAGASMARLYRLTGLVLPETPPFSTEGHLRGTLGAQGGHWIYDRFTGKVGASDIGGTLDYRSRQPRALLSGTVRARLLQSADLAPLIGTDSNASKSARGAATAQPAGRLLPAETFKTERWTSIDADVNFEADTIVRQGALPITQLSTHFLLNDGVLKLSPLRFELAGGQLVADITLDGSGKIAPNTIRARFKASARHVQLQKLFPTLRPLQASVGEINGDALLTATGNSVATLLGSSNGEVKSVINQGTISKLLLEEMGLNIGNVVLARLFGDKQVKLNCMATDFTVGTGLMQTRSFVVDTEEALLHVSGTINLANERLDLTLKPDTKGFRVFSLRSPLYVTGTFSKPDVSVDKGILALRAGGALALAVVAPVAALLPLVSAGPGDRSACAGLLAQARVRPVAPPPGQTMARRKPARH